MRESHPKVSKVPSCEMRILKVFTAHWEHESDAGYIYEETVGEFLPHLFTTRRKARSAVEKAIRADQTGGGGTSTDEPVRRALALQLKGGRTFLVTYAGWAPTVKPQKKPRPVRWIEEDKLISVCTSTETVQLWDGQGNPPENDSHGPTVVVVGKRLYQLETDKPVPLDPVARRRKGDTK